MPCRKAANLKSEPATEWRTILTAAHATANAFLHRAGLLTALLALIAGIFGMHVMTATHNMHSPAVVAVTAGAHNGSSLPL